MKIQELVIRKRTEHFIIFTIKYTKYNFFKGNEEDILIYCGKDIRENYFNASFNLQTGEYLYHTSIDIDRAINAILD